MRKTAGTVGYEKAIAQFINISQNLDFFDVCKDFVSYLPKVRANILDIGSGAGQNAAALAKLGHCVTAVEPMPEFLQAAQNTYSSLTINWLNGSLPTLTCLDRNKLFDFILIDAVWHHLSPDEQALSVERCANLLKTNGLLAISLRNGPAGLGTCVYATDIETTIKQCQKFGLTCIFKRENQPSILKNKADVKWARLVFKKTINA